MINIEISEVGNYSIEGFAVGTPHPLTLEVSTGSFNKVIKKQEYIEVDKTLSDGTIKKVMESVDAEEIIKTEYPAFTFDIESDDLLDVEYDVFLLEQPSKSGQLIRVNRTELDDRSVEYYEGEDAIKYELMYFTVPKGTTNLSDVKINVRKAVRKVANTDSPQ